MDGSFCPECGDFYAGRCRQHDPQPMRWVDAEHALAAEMAAVVPPWATGLDAFMALVPATADWERAERVYLRALSAARFEPVRVVRRRRLRGAA